MGPSAGQSVRLSTSYGACELQMQGTRVFSHPSTGRRSCSGFRMWCSTLEEQGSTSTQESTLPMSAILATVDGDLSVAAASGCYHGCHCSRASAGGSLAQVAACCAPARFRTQEAGRR